MPYTGATSVLAVKRALFAALAAVDTFAGANVRLGLPMEEPTEHERVYVLANLTRNYSDLTTQGGKDETYGIPVRLESRMIGATMDELEERLEAMIAAVMDAVEADRELDGACRDATVTEVEGPFAGRMNDNTGLFGVATVTVTVESWM